jgi:hypothetical protein
MSRGAEAACYEALRVIQVLDDLETVDKIEWFLVKIAEQILIRGQNLEPAGRTALTG